MMRYLAVFVFLCACSKKEKEAPARPTGPPELTQVEIDRGDTACKNYAKRVCACVETKADLKSECELAQAVPEALELAVGVAQQEAKNNSPREDKWAAFQNAQAIMKSCLEKDMNFKCE